MDSNNNMFLYSFIIILWSHKVQIIGGIIIGYIVFYENYKKYRERKKIKNIISKISEINYNIKIMSRINSDEFKKINEQDIREHEQIKAAMIGLELKMESGFEVINISLKSLDENVTAILDQTKITNGRVTALESHNSIKFFNFIKNYKVFAALIIIGLLALIDFATRDEFLKKIISLLF